MPQTPRFSMVFQAGTTARAPAWPSACRKVWAAGLLLAAGLASAQSAYPTRPISLVVPFPPGGSTDIVARAIAPKLAESLGGTVVIDNRPGAGTAIGAAHVAKAAPDGHTLLMGAGSTLTLNPAVRRNLPYDPVRDFAPVTLVSKVPSLYVVHPDLPAGRTARITITG